MAPMRSSLPLALATVIAACSSNSGPPPPPNGGPVTPGSPSPAPVAGWATGSVGYYRYPALRGDVIVFSAEGDLWQVARTGGIATRVTSHPGSEAYPALSADRKSVV